MVWSHRQSDTHTTDRLLYLDNYVLCNRLIHTRDQYMTRGGLNFYRASYASAVLRVVILSVRLSVCPSVCHTCAL